VGGDFRSSSTTSDNSSSICDFSVGASVRAFLISWTNRSRSAVWRCTAIVWYLNSPPRLDPFYRDRYAALQCAGASYSRFFRTKPESALTAVARGWLLAVDAELLFEHLSRFAAQGKPLHVSQGLATSNACHRNYPASEVPVLLFFGL
jgi:hypothetical protein